MIKKISKAQNQNLVNESDAAEYILNTGIGLIESNSSALRKLGQKYLLSKMYIFGSVTGDSCSEKSDFDILITFHDLPIDQYTDNFFDLQEDLEKLFGRKEDLLTERSISNPFFKEKVQQTRKLIYAA